VAVVAIGVDRSVGRSNDFDNFYDAAASVWENGELLREKGTSRYLPSFQVMMSPFGALPIEASAPIWILLNLASYAALVFLFARVFGVSPRAQIPAWFCVAPFVVSNLTLGQSGPLLLALSTAGIAAAVHHRDRLAGVALAAAGLLKVLPAALVAIPFFFGRIRGTVVGAGLAAAAIGVWMTLALGPTAAIDDSLRWFTEVRQVQTPDHLMRTGRSIRYNNQGLAVTLARTFGDFSPRPQAMARGSTQLLSSPVPLEWVWALYGGILATLAAVLAAVLWRLRRHGPGPRGFLAALALAAPVMLATSPIVWTHYFLWLLPGFIYLSDRRRALAAISVVSLAAIYWIPARGLGFHMALGLVQFGWVAQDAWRNAGAHGGTPSPVGASLNSPH